MRRVMSLLRREGSGAAAGRYPRRDPVAGSRDQPQDHEPTAGQRRLEGGIRQVRARRRGSDGDGEQGLHDRDAQHGAGHAGRAEPGGERTDHRRQHASRRKPIPLPSSRTMVVHTVRIATAAPTR